MSLWQWLFSYSGRISRGRFWAAGLAYIAALGIGAAAIWVFILLAAIQLDDEESASFLGSCLALLLALVLSVSGLSVAVKRFHDRGKSGWWSLLALVLAAGGAVVAVSSGNLQDPDLSGAAVFAGVVIWAIVDLGILPGQKGANRYGKDPIN